jgi:hypothetical protein
MGRAALTYLHDIRQDAIISDPAFWPAICMHVAFKSSRAHVISRLWFMQALDFLLMLLRRAVTVTAVAGALLHLVLCQGAAPPVRLAAAASITIAIVWVGYAKHSLSASGACLLLWPCTRAKSLTGPRPRI